MLSYLSVGITIQNAASGDYFELSNVTGTGFTILSIKNGSSFANQLIDNLHFKLLVMAKEV